MHFVNINNYVILLLYSKLYYQLNRYWSPKQLLLSDGSLCLLSKIKFHCCLEHVRKIKLCELKK